MTIVPTKNSDSHISVSYKPGDEQTGDLRCEIDLHVSELDSPGRIQVSDRTVLFQQGKRYTIALQDMRSH
jgi:hypothetical protein